MNNFIRFCSLFKVIHYLCSIKFYYMKHLLSKQQAEIILEPYLLKIQEAIESGFNDHLATINFHHSNGVYVAFNKKEKANIIHGLIRARIKKMFEGDTEVRTGNFNGVFGIQIKDNIFIRFKKINKDFGTSNILTKQTSDYKNQIEIPGIPEATTLLYAGYLPDLTWTSLKNIYIFCKLGDNLMWQIGLNGSIEQNIINFKPIGSEQEETIQKRVKVKDNQIKKTGTK